MEGGDVARMVYLRDGLGVGSTKEPGLTHPVRGELWIETRQDRQEALQQFCLAQTEVFMLWIEVISTIDEMVAAKMFRGDEVGVLDQSQEGKTGRLGDIAT